MMTEVHAAPGKVLKVVSTRSTSRLQVGALQMEEIEPLQAVQEIADVLMYDAFICCDTAEGYYTVIYERGATRTVWEIEFPKKQEES
jgi:hypothetical protein